MPTTATSRFTALQKLEANSIHLLRHLVARADMPLLLCPNTVAGTALQRLAHKAYFPAPPPLTLLTADEPPNGGYDLCIEPGAGAVASERPSPWSLFHRRGIPERPLRVALLADWAEPDLAAYGRQDCGAAPADNAASPPRRLLISGASGSGQDLHVAAWAARAAEAGWVLLDATGVGGEDFGAWLAAASTADAALLVVDVRSGLLGTTRRDAQLFHRLGVAPAVLVVAGLDATPCAQARFDDIVSAYGLHAHALGAVPLAAVPVASWRAGPADPPVPAPPWHEGPALLPLLAGLALREATAPPGSPRLLVQWVWREAGAAPCCAGRLIGGSLHPGDAVCIAPGGHTTRVARLPSPAGDLTVAPAGAAVMVMLADDVPVAPGHVVAAAAAPLEVADQFECTLVWTGATPLLCGRQYELHGAGGSVRASVTELKFRIDTDTLAHVAARTLQPGDTGVCALALEHPVPFEPYAREPALGAFVLAEPGGDSSVGAGMLHFALRRGQNVHPQALDVDQAARAALMGQQPVVVWLTGLSGAGKSTIANLVVRRLHEQGRHTYLLDGDNLRHGLNRDLGFTDADRVENIRRVAEVARLMVDAGLIVVTAFISPFRAERAMARRLFDVGRFVEVHVHATLELAEARDPKGLYAKARRGELPNFTGLDSPYEAPQDADVVLDTAVLAADQAAERVLAHLRSAGVSAS